MTTVIEPIKAEGNHRAILTQINVFFSSIILIRNVSPTGAFTGPGDIRRTVTQEDRNNEP